MFRGRTFGFNVPINGHLAQYNANGIYTPDEKILEMNQVYTDIQKPILQGVKIHAKIWTGTDNTESGYTLCEVDSSSNILREIDTIYYELGDAVEGNIDYFNFTIENSNCVGIAVFATHNMNLTINVELTELRKTEFDTMENPIDVIEHIKRHSNWQELGYEPSEEWGYSLVSGKFLPIDTAAFDALRTHDEYKDLKVSRQIFNVSDGDTDKIVQELCEAFFLVTYNTPDGLETISSLITPDLTPEPDIITYDKLRNNISNVEEAKIQDVFLNPEIKYAYDYATEEYKGHLKITNVDKATYNTEYSVNIGEPNGERIWDQCHKIWFRVKIIEPMPENLVNQKWISDYYTAVWRLEKITEWMQKKRVSITVSWDIGRLWEIGTYIKLNHPHITGGEDLRCVIESWEGNKNSDSVTCKLVLIDEVMIPPLTVSYFQNTTEKILEKQDTPDLTNEGQLV